MIAISICRAVSSGDSITTRERKFGLEYSNPAGTGVGVAVEGLTQEEIQGEARRRGLTEYPEVAVLSALSAAGADSETIRVMRKSGAPRKIWKLDLRLPKPTDYLYEIAGAMLWKNAAAALDATEEKAEKQPENPNVHLVYANLAKMEGDWIRAYGEAKEAVELAPASPYAHGLMSNVCYLALVGMRDARGGHFCTHAAGGRGGVYRDGPLAGNAGEFCGGAQGVR